MTATATATATANNRRRRRSMHSSTATATPLLVSLFILLLTATTTTTTNNKNKNNNYKYGCSAFSFSSVSATASSITSSTTATATSSPITNLGDRNVNSQLYSSSNDDSTDDDDDENGNDDNIIPITILSGFLGSGKTTILTHLLENKSGNCPVGVVINDVADVNIDGKLLKAIQGGQNGGSSSISSSSDGLVELENGCACCSLSDELLTSVSELVTLSDLRSSSDKDNNGLKPFKHIIIEMSGVSDPKNIRTTFQEAEELGMALMERIRLDTMITVIDSELFESYFYSNKTASRSETPELYREQDDDDDNDDDDEEEWMKDVPSDLLNAILGKPASEENGIDGVADLLVSQTETADVILLNKCDLLLESDSQDDDDNDGGNKKNSKLQRLKELVRALNPRPTTTIIESSYGRNVPIKSILGVAKGQGVTQSGTVDDHRDYVDGAITAASSECNDPGCTDESHSHSHAHSNHHVQHNDDTTTDSDSTTTTTTTDVDGVESSHSHSHSSHDSQECDDIDCTDATHSHSNSHEHNGGSSSECNDANGSECTDPTHDHSHSHNDHANSNSQTSTSTHAGIGTFVYRARRPFHPQRMVSFLRKLTIVRGLPPSDEDGDNNDEGSDIITTEQQDIDNILQSTLRSKGFVWCASSNINSMYWSHSGISFDYKCLGQWWATVSRKVWPAGVDEYVLQDYDNINHIEVPGDDFNDNDDAADVDDADASTTTDNTATATKTMTATKTTRIIDTVGDRRQEIVFIGLGFDSLIKQKYIQDTLDYCLLTTNEYNEYKSIISNDIDGNGNGNGNDNDIESSEMMLQKRFPSTIESTYVNN